MYDPEQDSWQEGLPIHISKTLKRRYFLVEKAKNASVIGESRPNMPLFTRYQYLAIAICHSSHKNPAALSSLLPQQDHDRVFVSSGTALHVMCFLYFGRIASYLSKTLD